jgi:hypothetical protein
MKPHGLSRCRLVPAENITKDPIDDVGRSQAMIMPARLAQRELGGALDEDLLDAREPIEAAELLGELPGASVHQGALIRAAELAEGVPGYPFFEPICGWGTA